MQGQTAQGTNAAAQPKAAGAAHNGTKVGHAGKHHHHHHKAQKALGIDLKEHFKQGGHKAGKGGKAGAVGTQAHHNGTAGAGKGAVGHKAGHNAGHNGTAAAGKEAVGHKAGHNGTAAAAGKEAVAHKAAAVTEASTNGGPCPGCSVPLNNEVGAFATDHIAAGAFALNFLAFIGGAGLLGFSLWRTRPKILGGSPDLQFYGLRVSLALFVVSRFFNWIFYAIPNSRSVTMGYLIFQLIPLVFLYASETTLVYTLARTALQPIAQCGGFQRTRHVSIGMTALFGVIAFIMWVLQAVTIGLHINARANPQDAQELGRAIKPDMYVQLVSSVLALIYGGAFVGMAVFGMRKSRDALGATYRTVPRFTLGAAGFWTVRAIFGIVLQVVPSTAKHGGESSSLTNFLLAEPILTALTENYLLLAAFGLLLLCFRSHLANLYVDGSMNAPIDKEQDPYLAQHDGLARP